MSYFVKSIWRLVGGLLFLFATTSFADTCSKERWSVTPSTPNSTINWKVTKGTVCASLNRQGFVDNFAVVAHAQHGVVGVTNGIADRGFAYRASSSYIGVDEFQVSCSLHPTYQACPVRCTVTVKVTVVDNL
jgi:hypothetical protein